MDKKEQITTNIMQLAETLNARYGNIIPKEKVGEAIERFSGSEEDYDIIMSKVSQLAMNYVVNYQKNQVLTNDLPKEDGRDSQTFAGIRNVYQKVQQLLASNETKVYLAGGVVPYLLLNQDSNRLHDDMDTVARMEDMPKLRLLFQQAGWYDPSWDSLNIAQDGQDYGFEVKIDGVPVGIYPFTYEDGLLTQYTYDPYNTACKIKEMPLHELSDYVTTYPSKDGKVYDMMSLEYIKKSKEKVNRQKDIQDVVKIEETGLLRKEVEDRIFPPREIQNKKAQSLNTEKTMGNATIPALLSAMVVGSFILLGTVLFFF